MYVDTMFTNTMSLNQFQSNYRVQWVRQGGDYSMVPCLLTEFLDFPGHILYSLPYQCSLEILGYIILFPSYNYVQVQQVHNSKWKQ
jgi:hypothetical protein